MWLFFGVIIGFVIGQWVIQLIEAPMENALANFYEQKARAELLAKGELPPLDQRLINDGFISEEVYIQPTVVLKELSHTFPELSKLPDVSKSAGDAKPPAGDAANPPGDAAKPPGDAAKPTGDAASAAAPSPNDAKLLPIMIWRESKNDPRVQLQSFNAIEPFMIYLKAAMLTGVILASPMIFRELWLFVAAGLYPHERRYVYIFLPFSIGLFLAGVLMGFFVAFPIVLKFLLGFNQYLNINPQQRIEEFFSFVLFLPLAFGVGFQLPLVMLFMNRIGLVSVQAYRKQWRIAILAIFVIAMILMPSPDVSSMALLAVPMSLLYFGGIALCAYTSGRRPAGLGGE
jgi:sec-independent protein translocase protein TatC